MPPREIDPVALTRALVRIPSPTGEERRVVEFLAGTLRRLGYHVRLQRVSPGRNNLLAWREPPVVVFSTHLDCVPPHVPLRETRTRIYGRGACDAKGIAAAMVAAAETLAARGERRLGLLFLVGEETGGAGARAARTLRPRGRYMINGEPTGNRLVTGAKGALWIELTARGKAAHSAYPERGRSAIDRLLDTVDRIRRLPLPSHPELGPATLNIGIVRGGVAGNVISPGASATLVFRTVTPTRALKGAIQSALVPDVKARVTVEVPGFLSAAPEGWDTTVVSFASDLPFLSAWGTGYLMGPGSIEVAHTEKEYIAKAELRAGVAGYVRLALDLLQRPV
ncbi:MAG: M20/M25/M40 family metallo-hydrolase [Gemmatimonadales bacterium]